ncbi:flavin reductase family protein [Sulfobacillus harzensis]|uniref:Flavin reductase family protein n=1 Tax=Sulfobacillus harzensis TaxID=2729629 RepID=A0A7Y0Q2M1_9FIRM|nr:flavin reductase family protein [Sulfobacillus harzensis]NMP21304.1 flavin reductase family protein [Sulfobacillus harzensis]
MDAKIFRDTLAQFATGITIVISQNIDRHLHGMTVNSFTSVSLHPPLVLFCADNRSDTFRAIEDSGHFTVSILSEEQEALSQRFALRGPQEALFQSLTLGESVSGIPYLADSLAFLDCTVDRIVPAGDHHLVLGRVDALNRLVPGRPLVYYQSQYQRLDAIPEPQD